MRCDDCRRRRADGGGPPVAVLSDPRALTVIDITQCGHSQVRWSSWLGDAYGRERCGVKWAMTSPTAMKARFALTRCAPARPM